jgi:hypothetical protein
MPSRSWSSPEAIGQLSREHWPSARRDGRLLAVVRELIGVLMNGYGIGIKYSFTEHSPVVRDSRMVPAARIKASDDHWSSSFLLMLGDRFPRPNPVPVSRITVGAAVRGSDTPTLLGSGVLDQPRTQSRSMGRVRPSSCRTAGCCTARAPAPWCWPSNDAMGRGQIPIGTPIRGPQFRSPSAQI